MTMQSRPLRGNMDDDSVRTISTVVHSILKLAEPYLKDSIDIRMSVNSLSNTNSKLVSYFSTPDFDPVEVKRLKTAVVNEYIKLEHLLSYYYEDIRFTSYNRARVNMMHRVLPGAVRKVLNTKDSTNKEALNILHCEYELLTEKFNASKVTYKPNVKLIDRIAQEVEQLRKTVM